jgi:hypothetical protein
MSGDSIMPRVTDSVLKHAKHFQFITSVPRDIYQIFTYPVQKGHRKNFLITIGATAVLLPVDIATAKAVKHLSRQIHLSPEANYKVPIAVGKTNIVKVPQNLNSGLYQLGEGGTSMLLAGGMYIYGKIKHDKVAVQTAADLTETFLTMGITTQLIKRITGRASPTPENLAGNGAKFSLFPSIRSYQQHTSAYDAFPSGHLATMMATVTTMALNYPEKGWIKPLGYTIMCLTSFAMINNDAHWVSDYPLALALGYVSAKITYQRHHRKIPQILPP